MTPEARYRHPIAAHVAKVVRFATEVAKDITLTVLMGNVICPGMVGVSSIVHRAVSTRGPSVRFRCLVLGCGKSFWAGLVWRPLAGSLMTTRAGFHERSDRPRISRPESIPSDPGSVSGFTNDLSIRDHLSWIDTGWSYPSGRITQDHPG